jgi:MinD superfamily P-loop ATPase
MKEIVILSGKGGAGKTTVSASLSVFLSKNDVIVDADVDAADMHILLNPKNISVKEFYSGKEPHIDNSTCTLCETCVRECPYNALSRINDKIILNQIDCEGCGLCKIVCPVNAIEMKEKCIGKKYISNTLIGIKMSHAELIPGEENSGKLVSSVRQDGRILINEQKGEILLIDGPPGIGCNSISAVTNSDLAVLVIESTLSGFHDIKRMIELLSHFNIESCAIINKYGLNEELDIQIENFLDTNNIEIAGRIKYSKNVVDALNKTIILSKYNKKYYDIFNDIFKKIKNKIEKE